MVGLLYLILAELTVDKGNLLLIGSEQVEIEQARVEQERQRAEQAERKAEQAERKATQLASRLRAMGIDPDAED